ncbi:MAG: YbbR-like domain-containing protein [Candidatus Omnitrophota bacterium]
MRIPEFIKSFFTKNIGLKVTALLLTLVLWFYVVGELNKGSEEEKHFLNKILPSGDVAAKQLSIQPVFIGKPRPGYAIDISSVMVEPDYCIVIGTKELLGKIRVAYTMPIDIAGASRSLIRPVALSPIAPGVYMEETFVQVTVPIEKIRQ